MGLILNDEEVESVEVTAAKFVAWAHSINTTGTGDLNAYKSVVTNVRATANDDPCAGMPAAKGEFIARLDAILAAL